MEVSLSFESRGVRLRVSDDGAGIADGPRTGGQGHKGMRERVRAINGRLEVTTGAQGTTIEVEVTT